MAAYYNEFDPFAAAWLRELIARGHIAPGVVDDRSILEVRPDDLRGFTQAHFFAGIGGWSLALRLAGWSDDRPVWTASCPCQPLSSAGQRKGHADERHLWPALYSLIAECRPATVFGEQVASPDGLEWGAGIRADLEDGRYACGLADLSVAGVGAPHIRQRLAWMAYTKSDIRWPKQPAERTQRGRRGPSRNCATCRGRGCVLPSFGADFFVRCNACRGTGWLANPDGRQPRDGDLQPSWQHGQQPQDDGINCRLGHTHRARLAVGSIADEQLQTLWNEGNTAAAHGPWGRSVLIHCADGKWRRVPANAQGEPEPRLFPLADAGTFRNRLAECRGSGNAINPWLFARFIQAGAEAVADLN